MLSGITDNLLLMDGLSSDGVVVHKASLLDIPFIFELLLEGAFIQCTELKPCAHL